MLHPEAESGKERYPFSFTTHREKASWIMRPGVGPGGILFYRMEDGKYFWGDNHPLINGSVFSSKSFEITAPFKTYFDFTYKCNLKCIHCITNSSPAIDISTGLPAERVTELTSELANMGVLEIATAGGEPFIYPEWDKVFQNITSQGMNLIITTNGLLLRPEIIKKLQSIKPLETRVSFDGGPNMHEKIRGAGTYKRALKGLSNLIENKINSAVRLTLCEGDDELPILFNDVINIGVQTIKVAAVKNAGRAATESGHHLIPHVDESVARSLLELGEKFHLKIQLSADDFPIPIEETNDPKIRDYRTTKCGAGSETCYISPEGKVLSCVTIPEHIFGSLRVESFRDVWHSKLVQDFKNLVEASNERRACDACRIINK